MWGQCVCDVRHHMQGHYWDGSKHTWCQYCRVCGNREHDYTGHVYERCSCLSFKEAA